MNVDERLEALETRLRLVEDRLAITDLVYRYGPAIDTGSVDDVLALFTEDGVYDVDAGRLSGAQEIADMVTGDPHQGLIHRGCSHVMSAPQIRIDGDRASVVSYSQLLLRDPARDTFTVLRATVNHWALTRTPDGWRVAQRTARKVDGSDEVRALLASHGLDRTSESS
ncbi:nuclear transport factor 2 family protein [Gordonia sihwensis]|uniref:nuclear transport factor 2 family protein n=1 Tax=Gordonia sihwensis TaxID=173559 RepID=UPI0024159C20|nr:nuclear transport factor 2 family protein [Gordonia sihwensis]WFN91428.1 nuclear transport factor 2 family protein [Gordonia sihwensis]